MKLNFFPIVFDFSKFQINVEQYSQERLNELRSQYNHTHSFFRYGDHIFISNKDGDENLVLGTPFDVDLYTDYQITSSLIKHVFFRTFKDRFPNNIPIDFYPFRFYSKVAKDDIIYDLLPEKLKGKIAYKKMIEINLRLMNINGNKQLGFVINTKRNWVFDISCKQLHEENFDIVGLDILHSELLPGMKNILAPNEEFVGVVKNVSSGKAMVETNSGIIEYPLEELFIRKTKFNIGKYIAHAAGERKRDEVLKRIEDLRQDFYNGKKVYNEIQNIANAVFAEKNDSNSFQPYLFQNKDGFCFTVQSNMLETSNSYELKTPAFIFDYAATKIFNTYPDGGLINFGPYDSSTFDTKSPNILAICLKENRGGFSTFLSSLIDGIPQAKYFKKGFQGKYDLHKVEATIEEINNFELSEYLKAIKNGLEGVKPDIAIIEIPSEFRRYDDNRNPYYKLKAKLLNLEIPVQFVTSLNIAKYNEFILNSIALQMYAKLGGTPWVLPSSRSIDREIVIGIGHSWIRQNMYKGAEQDRVVGITTFLSSDGQYLLGEKAKDVAYDDYFEELLRSLIQSFSRLENEQAWKDGDTIRLIFHIFKPIKNIEFEVVSKLIKEYTKYKIQFAFITVSKVHPYLLFNPNQPGKPKFPGSSIVKGEFSPDRGCNVFLDSTSCLVQMFGANEIKSEKHGMSAPILIKIRTPQGKFEDEDVEKLLFTDLGYVVQQIFSFTYLSWRNFLPGEEPATMLYSTLISRLLSKLRKVDGWDSDNLNYKLKRKKWFL